MRKVLKVIEKTINRDGQTFLIPEYAFETYWTTFEVCRSTWLSHSITIMAHANSMTVKSNRIWI
ncbi:hypothetical protein RP319_01525 [Heyndrickxia coagulans]|uniref:hypothetical protein n=1 Tax=Heyndrickxia coagulans TaxID=1398 RepID=UPI0028F8731E|nr:hypothetical protein [Heyndrickxia coagulans]MDT9754872.1 hypothetical protein [Heyndrickxia coagulans]